MTVSPTRPRHRRPTRARCDTSRRGQALATTFCATHLEVQPFTPGIADFSAFPVALWQRLQNKHWRMTYPDMLDYSTSRWLRAAAPRRCRLPARVSQRAARRTSKSSLPAAPSSRWNCALNCWRTTGHRVDRRPGLLGRGEGLHGDRPAPPPRAGRRPRHRAPGAATIRSPPKLIYLTPSHQYPTGAVMTLARRQQLLAHRAQPTGLGAGRRL